MEMAGTEKIERVLQIYTKLLNGISVNKAEEAQNYNVNERSIQRDIDDIRNFLECDAERTGIINEVRYIRSENCYRLEQIERKHLTNSEILAICKILLDSRAFTKKEMHQILEKLIGCCVPEKNQRIIEELIRNEEYHYIELQHKSAFIDRIWEIGEAIRQCRYIEIDYLRTYYR